MGLKGEFQLMQILGLLGMYFDAVVVEVEKYLLLFRLALASGRTVLYVKKHEKLETKKYTELEN